MKFIICLMITTYIRLVAFLLSVVWWLLFDYQAQPWPAPQEMTPWAVKDPPNNIFCSKFIWRLLHSYICLVALSLSVAWWLLFDYQAQLWLGPQEMTPWSSCEIHQIIFSVIITIPGDYYMTKMSSYIVVSCLMIIIWLPSAAMVCPPGNDTMGCEKSTNNIIIVNMRSTKMRYSPFPPKQLPQKSSFAWNHHHQYHHNSQSLFIYDIWYIIFIITTGVVNKWTK